MSPGMSRPPSLSIGSQLWPLVLVCAGALAACDAADDPPDDAEEDAGGRGGHGGRGGTAGSSGGSGGSAVPCSPCVEDMIGWGNNGGFVAFTERSSLDACNAYQHERRSVGGGGAPSAQCKRALPCMGSGLHGIADVLTAIEHADVRAALAKKQVLFGVDTRPVDGQVFEIVVGSSKIEVGMPCSAGATGCSAIPPGVSTLAQLLRAVDEEQLNLEPCTGMFD